MASASTNDLFRVDGLVALITGGGTGIGLMITKALAANGASKVYISGRRQDILHEVATIYSRNGNIIPLVADVTRKADLEAVADRIRNDVGHLNLVVANAGTMGPGPTHALGRTARQLQADAMRVSMDDWDVCFRTNVGGCYFTVMAVLDLLDEGNRRRNYCNGDVKSQVLINSSAAAFSRIVGVHDAYCGSKAAVTHLAKCLSTEFQEFGIRVNTLAPGLFPSELAARLVQEYKLHADQDGNIDPRRLPAQRIGTERDMVGTLLYLVSRAGAYNNGNVFVLDGGLLGVTPSTY